MIELSRRLPASQVEYNAGDLPITQDPTSTPRNGLSIEETIERIETCKSWMVLKFVEKEPVYRDLLHACLGEVAELSESMYPGMRDMQGFIFITSPGQSPRSTWIQSSTSCYRSAAKS